MSVNAGGRPRKPTSLKLVEGNPGRRPLPIREAAPRPGAGAPPRFLLPEAKREWRRISRRLVRLGLLGETDRHALAALCQAYARWQQAERILTRDGWIGISPKGGEYVRPIAYEARKLRDEVVALGRQFGLTPSSRSGVETLGADDAPDPAGEFLCSSASPAGYYFDEAAADRAERFFPTCLRHVKGRWAGQPFALLPWETAIIRELFGWRSSLDGTRRYRTAYIEVPRKNGKTSLGAGIAAYLLVADGELGAEVYSAAADRDQAAICFDICKGMVDAGPLGRHVTPFRRSLAYHRTASLYKPLSSDVPTKHGLNPSGIVFDELHAQRDRDLWDTLDTGTGARAQPLTVAITTAGTDPASLCGEIAAFADQVSRGVIDDPSFYSYVRRAEPEDDWRSPATWEKANPSYGVTVGREFFEAKLRKAEASPAYENTFRRLYLNQWLRQETRWINLDEWDACAGALDPLELRASCEGRVGYGGLDLSSNVDLTAWVIVFPPLEPDEPFVVVPRFFIPEERVAERVRRDRVPYDAWVRAGWIETTPGNVVDWRSIRDRVQTDSGTYHLAEVAFDRWGAVHVSAELIEAGLVMVQFGQGYASMSPPTRDLERLILERSIVHGGHPVLRWNMDNVAVETDPAGNLKPSKRRSTEKIDGAVAMIMGLDRATRGGANPDPASVYDERGIRTL